MKYMLMMQGSAANWDVLNTWTTDELKAHVRFMKEFSQQLTKDGELVEAQGLATPDQAKIVRASNQGAAIVTDGPFPEAKEFLAGFWIVDVQDEARAIAIAAAASVAPGPGGKPLNIPIEVRQVMSGPPVDV
jgi:hypothetical protein